MTKYRPRRRARLHFDRKAAYKNIVRKWENYYSFFAQWCDPKEYEYFPMKWANKNMILGNTSDLAKRVREYASDIKAREIARRVPGRAALLASCARFARMLMRFSRDFEAAWVNDLCKKYWLMRDDISSDKSSSKKKSTTKHQKH